MHITIHIPGYGLPSPVIGPYEAFTSWRALESPGGEQAPAPFEVITATVEGDVVAPSHCWKMIKNQYNRFVTK